MNRSFVSRFFLTAITMALLSPLHAPHVHAAQPREPQALIPVSKPDFLPIGTINMSPTNISTLAEAMPGVPVPERFFYRNNNMMSPILPPDLVSGIIQSQVAPTAVSYLASYMKNPYILLAVGEGVAISYLLMGEQAALPQNILPAFKQEFENQLPVLGVAAAKGALTALSEAGMARVSASRYSSYLKPLIIGTEVVGAVSAYYSPHMTDTEKALTYATVAASITPVLSNMFTAQQELTVKQKMKQGIVARAQEQVKHRGANVAVALIALGAAATTFQAWQSGDLSAETQMLAGVTLGQVAAMAQEWSVYEYGYRATKQVVNAGAYVASYIQPVNIKQHCHRLVSGMFNAFGWGSARNNNP